MKLVLEIIGSWILLSCVVGPCLTWAFFYSKRRAQDTRTPERRNVRKVRYDGAAVQIHEWATSTGLRPPT